MSHIRLLSLGCLVAAIAFAGGQSRAADSASFRAQVEADWVRQDQVRLSNMKPLSNANDAAGGCDGVKNGLYGFHTHFNKDPWWQVDLGSPQAVGRVVVWNRCDSAADRVASLSVQLSDDGWNFRTAYTHGGGIFYGHTDGKPLEVALQSERARYVRIQLSDIESVALHLDEVEVFGTDDPALNLALGRPASQSSLSVWSVNHQQPEPVDWRARTGEILARCQSLAAELSREGLEVSEEIAAYERVARAFRTSRHDGDDKTLYFAARWLQRRLTLAHPVLDFDAMLFTKRVPGSYSHMSDQYYGWWSRPGGGIYTLRDFRDAPSFECITDAFEEAGSFLRPMLSHDGTKLLFAWCKHYPYVAGEQNKLDKATIPEDAFYHVFEMNVDGTSLRQLTRGKYDDFDARYLPDGRIVFLSTRRGRAIQCGQESARLTMAQEDLPDIYVRCGGGPSRPVAVYTLHTMDADGGDLCAISGFEMFEWTPSVAHDGTILYSRWDYVDRRNGPFMSLWSTHPDGTNPRLVYGNFSQTPHCTFEPRAIPNSNKIVFTASAHHAQTMGSLVLLDPAAGTEFEGPITRLTPEVVFPESEGWSPSCYANPWPLSERFYLVSWGEEPNPREGSHRRANGMGLYLFDATGNMELLYADPEISCFYPMPLRERERPPVVPSVVKEHDEREGRFLVSSVYHGLPLSEPGNRIKALRIVAVPPKTHPSMNYPVLGIMREDPGKCVLGTVPVEEDGSAYFRVPSGVNMFFQALDEHGAAVRTMRSITYVQPGQTLGCIGCHEPRMQAPPQHPVSAAMREPSKITPGPPGSWPLRFDRLVQPVLDRHCVDCHHPGGEDSKAAAVDLTAAHAYENLLDSTEAPLSALVKATYFHDSSPEEATAAFHSPMLRLLYAPGGHHGVHLSAEDAERLFTWVDTYAQKLGSFDDRQEEELLELRERWRDLLEDRPQEAVHTARLVRGD